MRIHDLDLLIPRGDTASIDVELSGDIPEDGTIALVSMKHHLSDKNPLWSKEYPVVDGKFTIELSTDDTDYPPNTYKWDIRLLYSNGEVHTPMAPANFEIGDVVGDAESDEED